MRSIKEFQELMSKFLKCRINEDGVVEFDQLQLDVFKTIQSTFTPQQREFYRALGESFLSQWFKEGEDEKP